MDSFSDEQKLVFEKYLAGKNIFVTGPGGSGKSFLIKHIYKHAKERGKTIKVCAMTGCASILLECDAITLHSFAGFSLAKDTIDIIIGQLFEKRWKLKNWAKLDTLIVDEISMMSLKIFRIIEMIGRKYYKHPNLPFGGLQVIFTGDFYQLSPVNADDRDPEASMFCFQDPLFSSVFHIENQIVLNTIFRQKDEALLKILKYVRQGRITHSTKALLESRLFKRLELEEVKQTKVLTVLSPIRRDVEKINRLAYLSLKIEEKHVYSIKYVHVSSSASASASASACKRDESLENALLSLQLKSNPHLKYEYEYLANNLMAEKTIELKIGCHVMCVANILTSGIANGSQGIVVGFTHESGLPLVKFNSLIEPIVVGYHMWKSESHKTVAIEQIPLIYAWAVTIHKAQGTTLENAIIDIGSNIFAEGQTYVALSRVKSLEGLYLTSFDYTKIRANRIVKQFYGDS